MHIFLFTLISYMRVFLILGFNGRQNMNAKYLRSEILAGLDGHIRIISIIEMIKYYHKVLILIKPILLGAAIIILFNCRYNKVRQADLKIPYQISMIIYASCGILLLGVFGIGIFQ